MWKSTLQKALEWNKRKKDKNSKHRKRKHWNKQALLLMKNKEPNYRDIQLCVQVFVYTPICKDQNCTLPLFLTPATPDLKILQLLWQVFQQKCLTAFKFGGPSVWKWTSMSHWFEPTGFWPFRSRFYIPLRVLTVHQLCECVWLELPSLLLPVLNLMLWQCLKMLV